MAVAHSLFVQIVDDTGCRQGRLGDIGQPLELQPCPPPLAHIRARFGRAGRLLESHKRALRLLVRGIYLSPILLVPKCVLWSWGRPEGESITLFFVALVLLFFVAVSVYLVLFAVAGPPSKRRRGWCLCCAPAQEWQREPPLGEQELRQLLDAAGDQSPVKVLRARGQARAFHAEAEGPLLRDLWAEADGSVLRAICSRPFVLENGDQPTIVVPAGVPVVLAEYQQCQPGSDEQSRALEQLREVAQLPRLGTCMRLELREGSWLDLVAPRHRRVDDLSALVLEGLPYRPRRGEAASSPYRSGAPTPALMALPDEREPILLWTRASGTQEQKQGVG